MTCAEPRNADQPVIIAGAGPVGLTLALLLHRQGRAVSIYEVADELHPLGVGINLLPHSVRVLYDLDLANRLDATGIRTAALHYYNKFGQRIWAEPRGLDAGYRFPQYSIHRGRFQQLLLETVRERLGPDAVRCGHRLVGWQEVDDGVAVTLERTDGSTITARGACLVAADGIHSAARQHLYPEEGPPIYGGRVLWRGITVTAPFLDGRTMIMAGHQNCKFVAYPIDTRSSGLAVINWIAELAVPDHRQHEQDWNKEVAIEKFRGPFASWRFDWLDVPALIDRCEHVFEFPLADRDPLPRWSHGRMTLIGDAAHPMYPIGSNGASQGILDAEKLADELARTIDITAAFAAYEAERRPATAAIVLANRQNGPEQVMQIVEERAPDGFDDVHDVISQHELETIAARYAQTAGFTVEAVNGKANKQTQSTPQ